MSEYDFAVVVPAFNAAMCLGNAVESALRAGATEVVVVDDGSTDETANVARSLNCTLIMQPNAGAAIARQAGVEAVDSPMVILLDADDLLIPTGLTESLKLAASSATWVAVAGATEVRGPGPASLIFPWPEGISVSSLLARGHSPGPPGAFLWNTKALKRVYRGDPPALRPRYAEDYELLVRGAMFGEVLCHHEITCSYASTGGKSALAPLRSNAAAEDIRRFYAKSLQLNIRERSANELQSMAYLRQAYASPRGSLKRFLLYIQAALRSPLLLPRLMLRKAGRRFGRKQ